MNAFTMDLWTRSWQAAVIVVIVLAVFSRLVRRLPRRWRYGLWGIALLRLVLPALPWGGTSSGPLVARAYDVRDLVVAVPDFVNAPSLMLTADRPSLWPASRPTGVVPPSNAPTTAAAITLRADELISILKETIDPGSWDRGAIVRPLSGELVIFQTQANHEAIDRLLKRMREDRNTQITVETRMVAHHESDSTWSLPADLRDKIGAFGNGGQPQSGVLLEEPEVNLLLRATQGSMKVSIVTPPRITLFNGQRAYTSVVHQRAYNAGYTVATDKEGGTQFLPRVETVSDGVVLDVQVVAAADRKSVAICIRDQFCTFDGMIEKPFQGGPANQKLSIQQPMISLAQVLVNTNIPEGRTMLFQFEELGAAGVPNPSTRIAQPATAPFLSALVGTTRPSRLRYLLVKPEIISRTSNAQKTFPLLRIGGPASAPASPKEPSGGKR